MNDWVALVTLSSLIVYVATLVQVGRGRARYGVAAPAMTGHPEFERLVRVQANTLEGLVIYLPSLWLFAVYAEPRLASVSDLAGSSAGSSTPAPTPRIPPPARPALRFRRSPRWCC